MHEPDDEEYRRIVECLMNDAAADFAGAAHDLDEQRRACQRYFSRGRAEGLGVPELVDFLGVSSPSVLDRAGYSDDQQLRVMASLAVADDDAFDAPSAPD